MLVDLKHFKGPLNWHLLAWIMRRTLIIEDFDGSSSDSLVNGPPFYGIFISETPIYCKIMNSSVLFMGSLTSLQRVTARHVVSLPSGFFLQKLSPWWHKTEKTLAQSPEELPYGVKLGVNSFNWMGPFWFHLYTLSYP